MALFSISHASPACFCSLALGFSGVLSLDPREKSGILQRLQACCTLLHCTCTGLCYASVFTIPQSRLALATAQLAAREQELLQNERDLVARREELVELQHKGTLSQACVFCRGRVWWVDYLGDSERESVPMT